MSSNRDVVTINLDPGNSVEIDLHGATVTSWQKAVFDGKKAIRGGIPIVFPHFGPWDNNRPQHGFARVKKWKLQLKTATSESANLTLTLSDDDETRKLWNYKFDLIYELCLKRNALESIFTVVNKDQQPFDFTCLLHSYIRTSNINDVAIHGLENVKYIDKVDNGVEKLEKSNELRINSEVDRVYKSSIDSILLEVGNDEELVLVKHNFPDLVVWNPWVEKSSKMSDFDAQEYNQMFCAEPGHVSERVVLKPGERFTARQELLVVLKERL